MPFHAEHSIPVSNFLYNPAETVLSLGLGKYNLLNGVNI